MSTGKIIVEVTKDDTSITKTLTSHGFSQYEIIGVLHTIIRLVLDDEKKTSVEKILDDDTIEP